MNFKRYDDYGVLNIEQGGWNQVDGYVVRMTPSAGIYYTARISQIDYVPIGHPDKIIVSGIANKAIEVSVLTLRNDNYIIAELGWKDNGSEFTLGTYDKLAIGFRYQDNTNITPNDVNDKKVYNWFDINHYIHNTSTDTITTPADIYANDTTATVGLKGDMEQSSTPTPTNPIQPSECGERMGNLFDKTADYIVGTTTYNYTISGLDPNKFYTCSTNFERISGVSTASLYFNGGSSDSNGVWSDTPRTFKPNSSGEITVYIRYRGSAGAPEIYNDVMAGTIWAMVNEGSTALPYEPYGYKIPILNNSQTTNVYLGEVETTRKIKKLVLTGEEDWIRHGVLPSWFQLALSDVLVDNLELCTHYKPSTHPAGNIENGEILAVKQTDSNNGRIIIKDTNYTAKADFLAYLSTQYAAGTPVTIWYVLAEPTTGIVNEPLRKIGDYADIVSGITIPTIAGANTISVDTTLQPSEVTVNYKGWHKASEIVHRYQYGEWDGSPPPTYPVYGFKIDKNNDDPDTRVTYLYDAEGMTPAYMDFSNGTFNYGSWANAWFIKNNRPVALKFDGTVDYELNHTDFTKKLDGTASDVEDANYAGNFMSEMPTVYVKRWEDNDYNYMAFCEIPYDEDFLAHAHTNANGTVNNAIYLPMFKGKQDRQNKLRSLMGTYSTTNTTGTNETTYSANCGTGWQIWDKAKIDLIMDLIVLITKSTNCKAKIGNGVCYTQNIIKSGYEADGNTRSANAQFYGSEGTEITNYGKHHMCAFFIEDLWGNRWDRCLGFNLVGQTFKIKMVAPYSLDGDNSYEALANTMSGLGGWLKNISSTNTYGDVPIELNASSTSGFASNFTRGRVIQNSCLAAFGGSKDYGTNNGRYWSMYYESSNRSTELGASPCYSNPT